MEKNVKWKVSIKSSANNGVLSEEQIDRIMNCFKEEEYQDWRKEIIESDKKYDIYPTAKWQLKKSIEIEEIWHNSIKYIIDDVVKVDVNLEIDFPESFDKGDVIIWCEGMNRLNKIYLMVQQKDMVKNYKLGKEVDRDKNENKFLEELIKNQKTKVKKVT